MQRQFTFPVGCCNCNSNEPTRCHWKIFGEDRSGVRVTNFSCLVPLCDRCYLRLRSIYLLGWLLVGGGFAVALLAVFSKMVNFAAVCLASMFVGVWLLRWVQPGWIDETGRPKFRNTAFQQRFDPHDGYAR